MGAYQMSYGTGPSSALLPGMVPRSTPNSIFTRANKAKVAQVETAQATSTTLLLTLTKEGVARAFSVAGADATASAVALKAAIEADGVAFGWVSITRSTDTLTLTARETGLVGAVTYSLGTNVTLVQTVAATDGTVIPFGNFVMQASDIDACELPSAAAGVAQVSTVTPTAVNSLTYQLTITMTGGTYNGIGYTAVYVADGSATVQEIVEGLTAQINALMPASTVLASEDNSVLTLTAEVLGTGFTFSAGSSTTAVVTLATTTANTAIAFTRRILGVALRDQFVAQSQNWNYGVATAVAGFPAAHPVPILNRGPVIVSCIDTWADGDPVYIVQSAGAGETAGQVRNDADSGDATLLAGAVFVGSGAGTAAAPLGAEIELNLPA